MSVAQDLSDLSAETFETLIPARLDRLPWSRFHTLLVLALGITWILDGLEVTLMGAIAAVLTSLEDRFGFIVEDDEVDGGTFATVGTLVAFVNNKLLTRN